MSYSVEPTPHSRSSSNNGNDLINNSNSSNNIITTTKNNDFQYDDKYILQHLSNSIKNHQQKFGKSYNSHLSPILLSEILDSDIHDGSSSGSGSRSGNGSSSSGNHVTSTGFQLNGRVSNRSGSESRTKFNNKLNLGYCSSQDDEIKFKIQQASQLNHQALQNVSNELIQIIQDVENEKFHKKQRSIDSKSSNEMELIAHRLNSKGVAFNVTDAETEDEIVKESSNEPRDDEDENDEAFDATSANTISPEAYMNGYMKFIMDSSQVPLVECNEQQQNYLAQQRKIPIRSSTNNQTTLSKHNSLVSISNSIITGDELERLQSPKVDLTHDQVLELFETTCKEIDEWKQTSYHINNIKLNNLSTYPHQQQRLSLNSQDDDRNYTLRSISRSTHNNSDESVFQITEVGQSNNKLGHGLYNEDNDASIETEPKQNPSKQWFIKKYGNYYQSIDDEPDVKPTSRRLSSSSSGIAIESTKRSSSVSSTNSHLSFPLPPNLNSNSSTTSPSEKLNNNQETSGTSSPDKVNNSIDANITTTKTMSKKRKEKSKIGTNVVLDYTRDDEVEQIDSPKAIMFKIGNKVDFKTFEIESKPDFSASLTLSLQSSKIPNKLHCIQLNEKLIKPLFDVQTCKVQRTLYLRDDFDIVFHNYQQQEIESGKLGKDDIKYEVAHNINFKKSSYESQYILTKIDNATGKSDSTTRAGLCPYCETIEFFGLKNSSYGNHLAYKHGILTNGRSVPDPKFYGLYKFKKGEYDEPEKKKRKTNAHILERNGVLCTCCWQILEVNCTSRSSILGHYLRHYRDSHVGYKKENKYEKNYIDVDEIKSGGSNGPAIEDKVLADVVDAIDDCQLDNAGGCGYPIDDPDILKFLNNWRQ
ncbi:hypothetical protein KGF54_005459 [Candida jiufengensis]|uniref:uncharacterized protein n=1 Tax=Candida jiufengensis TaxID=497108 RepID=UPI00222507A1|nr:uncharacterized protein KGF54_005459 [Candida jiufengensis]KAI5949582.1 hypothetical protein KGF54_005459 [Candida jiufengensis]